MNLKASKVSPWHIASEWSEGHPNRGGDGYWISLKPGWKWAGDALGAVHSIHEATRKLAHAECVIPCTCKDCQPLSPANA